jgi:hypothetical protein
MVALGVVFKAKFKIIMKQRIFSNWTLRRVLYLVLGIVVMVQSVMTEQWFGLALGAYFASMGLFAFGCAGGQCYGSAPSASLYGQNTAPMVEDIKFEEVKNN